MKKTAPLVLALLILAGTASAQKKPANDLHDFAGVKECSIVNGQVCPKGSGDAGPVIWDNNSLSAWWSGCDTGYLNLDWSVDYKIPASGLPDHVIDGGMFAYGTNNMDSDGEDFSIYYFDDCTGWGNKGTQQAVFYFADLPNGAYLPTLPPGYGWIWTITYDLEGGGYEFLLNDDFGIGIVRESTPTMGMGSTGLAIGTRMFNGTQNAYDIYYPNDTYNGTWWFGSAYWATWPAQLMGDEGEENGTFYGIGAQGNDASLYIQGEFGPGTFHFMGDKEGCNLQGNLIASSRSMSTYIGHPYDVTRLVGNFLGGFPQLMQDNPNGDFCTHDILIPPSHAGRTCYFQMVLSDSPMTAPPMDASNGIRMN